MWLDGGSVIMFSLTCEVEVGGCIVKTGKGARQRVREGYLGPNKRN